jgi:hypothetical protein
MAQWRKAPEVLVRLMDDAMRDRGGERKTMFGFPVYFVKGNMFCGVFEDRLFFRPSPDQLAGAGAAAALETFEPTPGRPMRNYRIVPVDVRGDAAALSGLLDPAVAHAASLPPKERKPKGPRKPGKG